MIRRLMRARRYDRLRAERDAARQALVTLAYLQTGEVPPPWPLAGVTPAPDWWHDAAQEATR